MDEATPLCDTKRIESAEELQSMGVPSPGLRLQARPRRGSDDQSSQKKGADQGDDTSKHLRSGTELTSPQYKTIAAFDQYSQKQSSQGKLIKTRAADLQTSSDERLHRSHHKHGGIVMSNSVTSDKFKKAAAHNLKYQQ